MKKLFILFLFSFSSLLIGCGSSSIYDDYTDELQNSTIIVVSFFYDSDSDEWEYGLGTGFFVGDPAEGIFVTALHVVAGADEVFISYGYKKGETINPNFPKNYTQVFPQTTSKKFYWWDESRDLVIFKVKDVLKMKPKGALSFCTNIPKIGSNIYTCGHTLGEYYYNHSSSTVSGYKEYNGIKYILTGFPNAGPGNSGGAVVNESSCVIGMIQIGDTRISQQYAIPSKYISFLYDEVNSSYGFTEFDKKLKEINTPEGYKINRTPYDENMFKK
ncbi:MAG: trypsin-like peptidase domain-containing protein [Ignavibacteria bacterium]|nr:trypsin-like peptidase domain-containing protein [Ignavibacteria bacterium]